jgi:hypothetical protein
VPLPDGEYLLKIGQLAYAVAYLEWLVLGDLHTVATAGAS